VELEREPRAVSDLIGRSVRDGSGRSLGRVFELRGHRDSGGQVVIDELLIGRRALWRRLRGPGKSARSIPWESIAEITEDAIVVAQA
jgi:sporulation protein YlmC with PRC-barrel domain